MAAVDRDYDDARREWPQSAAVGGLERKMRAFERQCEVRAHEWAVAEAERIKVAAVNKAPKLKTMFMKMASGVSGETPKLMRGERL